jgi:hypothetical protein
LLLAFVLLAGAIYRQQFATFKTLAVQFATSLSPVSVPPLLWRTDALQASFQRTTSLRSLVVNQTAASAAAANCLLRSTLSCVPNWRARARAIERAADGRGRREGRKGADDRFLQPTPDVSCSRIQDLQLCIFTKFLFLRPSDTASNTS